jgi:hypothetical protein
MPIHVHATFLPRFSYNDAALFLYIAIARWQHSVLFTVFARWCEKSEMVLVVDSKGPPIMSIQMSLIGNHLSIHTPDEISLQ